MDDGLPPLPAEFDRLQAPSSAYAPRQVVTYLCTREHVISVPFAAEAEVPEAWECRFCGTTAIRVGAGAPEPKKTKPVRTHMDMLRERRSTADLEEVLREALEMRHRATDKKKSA